MPRFPLLARLAVSGLTLAAVALAPLPAVAQTADELRSAARACEQPDGFMRALDPAAQTAVEAINTQRRGVYQEQATREGVDISAVGAVYAQQIGIQPNYRAC